MLKEEMEKMNVTSKVITVLILILMEHAQRDEKNADYL